MHLHLVCSTTFDGIEGVSSDWSGSLVSSSIAMAVLGTGNLHCEKWLEAAFLPVINLFGGRLQMLSFLIFTSGRPFQQSKMDGFWVQL
jgi:hypothetical protein